ncbi:MAG: tRNA lysidine(34) synthetase TilS [Micrococcales bacterium]|nr:tRNA lysidine(34) synthetase TilS [Micrococcales bacterium]
MTRLDSAVAAIRLALRQALGDLPPRVLVLVACSGGPDSLALAAATAFVAPRLKLQAGAVCVDHGIQQGSDAVAKAAAKTCLELGLDPVSLVLAATSVGPNLEAEARQARYQALAKVAADTGATAILLGHTLNDQAETVLLAMGRGAGLTALAGMAPQVGLLRRPLLGITRAQTIKACQALDLEPWHDPMNQLDGPGHSARVIVRNKILPELEVALGGGVAAALAKTARQVAQDREYLDQAASKLLDQAKDSKGGIAAKLLGGTEAALRLRALRQWVLEGGADPAALTAAHIQALDGLVCQWHGQGPTSLPGGLEVGRTCGKLEVLPNQD